MAGAACNPGRDTAREITPVFTCKKANIEKQSRWKKAFCSFCKADKWTSAILSFPPFHLDYFVTGTGSNLPNMEIKTLV